MRWIILSAMLVVATIAAAGDGVATLAKSIRLPSGPLGTIIVDHPLVGDWVEMSSVGAVPAHFGADGSLVMRFPDVELSRQGTSFIGGGIGTWEPVGDQAAVYTVVRAVSHANGVDLGTITIQGYLTLSLDGLSFTDDGRLTVVTHRDAKGNIISVAGASETAPATVATRAMVGQTGIAHDASAQSAAPVVPQGRGCNTCR